MSIENENGEIFGLRKGPEKGKIEQCVVFDIK